MKKTWGLGAALLAGTALLATSAAWAATETDNLSVSANVTNECSLTVEAGGLNFGTIDTNDNSSVTADADVDLGRGTVS